MNYLNTKSLRIYDFIRRYMERNGFPPTLDEIAAGAGFRSRSGVVRHLDKLETCGWIARRHGNARSIRLLRG